MDFETWKEINENKCLEAKFHLFNQAMQNITFCSVEISEAERRSNEADENYWRKEREGQNKRAEWLFEEIVDGIHALEGGKRSVQRI